MACCFWRALGIVVMAWGGQGRKGAKREMLPSFLQESRACSTDWGSRPRSFSSPAPRRWGRCSHRLGSFETLHAPRSELVFSFEPLDSGVRAGNCGEAWGTVCFCTTRTGLPVRAPGLLAVSAAAPWGLWLKVSRLIR